MSKLISDKDFFNFDWPPKFSYTPKRKKRYDHHVTIKKAITEETLVFTSPTIAKLAKKYNSFAKNVIEVTYRTVEVPAMTEEGLIEQ